MSDRCRIIILSEGVDLPAAVPTRLTGYRFENIAFVSPWSGDSWAKITQDPGRPFVFVIRGAPGTPPAFIDSMSGSLFDLGEASWGLTGFTRLPRELLVRELDLVGVDVARLLGHNSATQSMESPMSTLVLHNLTERIAELRSKVASNNISDEELREGLRLLRQQRVSASAISAKSRAAKGPAPSGDDVLAMFQ